MKATYLHTSTSKEPSKKDHSEVKSFDYTPLNRVVFGSGSIQQLGKICAEFSAKNVLLVSDPGIVRAGHTQKAISILDQAGIKHFLFTDVEENPEEHHVIRGTEFLNGKQIDLIIALGGGSSMDCAKGINFLLTNGGKMRDYQGIGLAKKPMLPSIGIPTTSGTGSEAQSFALITDSSTHLKMACGDKKAAFKVCILDPELTVSQPRIITAATGIDAVAHALESYVSKKHTIISQTFARQAWQLLSQNFPKVLSSPTDILARGHMQLGAHLAGCSIENSMLGVCHSCANPLTAHYGIPHGIAIGILLPHVLKFNAKVCDNLYADLAFDLNENSDGLSPGHFLAEKVKEFTSLAGLPANLHECGVSHGILELLAEEASEQWTAKFNPREVSQREILELYHEAMH